MERSREEILSLINDIEQKYELVDWQEYGIHVWPIIRIFIFNELTEKKVTGTRSKTISSNKFSIFFNGLKELFLVRKKLKNAKSLFFASQAHRQSINGVNYNRFVDPLMDNLSKDDTEIQILFETAKQNEYTYENYKGYRLFQLSPILDLLHLMSRIKNRINKPAFDVGSRIGQMNELPIGLRKKLVRKMSRQLPLIPVYQSFSGWLLRQYQGDKLYFVCYYGLFNMVIISEARKLNMSTIDIQHGVISDKHIAYAFKKMPKNGYNSLPNEFWTWTNYEVDCINQWASAYPQHQATNTGNAWIQAIQKNKINFGNLDEQIKYEEKPIILYTLSNRDDIFPDFLIEAIKKLSGEFSFWFRLHPRQIALKDQIGGSLKSLGIFDLVELNRATDLPLPLILKYTHLHITQFSTVVLEAAHFKVSSILIHTLGRTYFADNPLKDYFYFYDLKKGSFEELIKKLMKND
ncbi:hypothetical protein JKA74_05685 [Marivirga sp. S37H4]|uniref:Uncharacterized protein n=1 Tax=Marivirga aurantiaca TaxID=2802615 RepID=A0A935C7R7_9BACT|nr:hypothetical protein [Marivirga aurantiaca]MBK6264522.1 hypothetical protein [Marivirga aurantiaca]